MKRCRESGEESAGKSAFCPAYRTRLETLTKPLTNQPGAVTAKHVKTADFADQLVNSVAGSNKPELQLTMIDESNLLQRLVEEIRSVGQEVQATWPRVRDNPLGYGKTMLQDGWRRLSRVLHTSNVLAGASTAVLIVITAVILALLVPPKTVGSAASNRSTEIVLLDLSHGRKVPSEVGIGTGRKGRVGLREGTGEGSRPEPKRSHGGGGGGLRHPLDVQSGRIPQASDVLAPIINPTVQKNRALPVAGIDIDPLLWKSQPLPNFGDPRALTTTSSNGPGTGGGMGNNNGTGIGEGSGPGFGPGANGNIGGGQNDPGGGQEGGSRGNNLDDPNRVMRINEVTHRVRVLSKPEPQYTEDARRNQIVGTVVLRVIFTGSGEVTNIRVVQPLPFGLTERAIAAARQIRFLPASKDGHPVSVYMQLEYNFNLY